MLCFMCKSRRRRLNLPFPSQSDTNSQVESGTTVKGSDSVDIGCGNAFGGDDEAVDDSVEKVRLVLI